MDDYKIYTDGSYRSSKNQGGVGIVWLKNDEFFQEYSRGFKNTTNNKMELIAILIALFSIKNNINSLEIFSDSEYAIGCISNDSWNPKKNKNLITTIKKLLQEKQKLVKLPIKFTHVYGHQDNVWNNRCDKLCSEASNMILL